MLDARGDSAGGRRLPRGVRPLPGPVAGFPRFRLPRHRNPLSQYLEGLMKLIDMLWIMGTVDRIDGGVVM